MAFRRFAHEDENRPVERRALALDGRVQLRQEDHRLLAGGALQRLRVRKICQLKPGRLSPNLAVDLSQDLIFEQGKTEMMFSA